LILGQSAELLSANQVYNTLFNNAYRNSTEISGRTKFNPIFDSGAFERAGISGYHFGLYNQQHGPGKNISMLIFFIPFAFLYFISIFVSRIV
jgi:hypothetical protein